MASFDDIWEDIEDFGNSALSVFVPGYAAYRQQKTAKKQQKVLDAAQKKADEQAVAAERAYNKANGKSPNIQGFLSSNSSPMSNGTMLTGATGVDPQKLKLSKTSLLGE